MVDLIKEIELVNLYLHDNRNKFNTEIGEMIKEERIKNNIKISEFSSRTIMTESQISQIERGKRGLTLNKFVIICNSLGIKPGYFLDQYNYYHKTDDDILYYEMQESKNISENILQYIIKKNNIE